MASASPILGTTFNLQNLLGGVNLNPDPSGPFMGQGGAQVFMPASDASIGTGASSGSSVMGGLSVGMAVGQAIGGVYGAWKGGKTLDYVMKKQAQIAENNRQMAQLSAESALAQGAAQVAQITYRAGQIKAKQRVGYARAGVAIGEGSSAEVMASTDVMKELDAGTARMNALATSWGFKNAALQANAQSAIYRAQGNYATSVAGGQAFGSLLEGGMEVADRWYKYFGSD